MKSCVCEVFAKKEKKDSISATFVIMSASFNITISMTTMWGSSNISQEEREGLSTTR